MVVAAPAIDEQAVLRAAGSVLANGKGISLHGWDITAASGHILGDDEVEQLKVELGEVLTLPEQLFGSSYVQLQHMSGLCIHFRSKDALIAWHEARLPALKLPISHQWQAARQQELQSSKARTLEYDWTYTTPYTGCVKCADAPGRTAVWVDSPEQLPKHLLLARDPILMYAAIPLYVSELDDNGVAGLDVKVRVMPRCAYVLLRFYLRVDQVLVRLRETRLCIEFDQNNGLGKVLREVKVVEGTFEELKAAGAPPAESLAYAEADSAALALQAVAPIGVKHFSVSQLHW